MIQPGQTCNACGRRVPHERKPTTPTSVPFSYRVPVDEVDAHRETLEAAARFLSTYERPHWQFWTYVYALARVLQDSDMQGIAQRQAA